MKYYKESVKFPGIKEYYEISGVNLSIQNRNVGIMVNRFYCDDDGYVKTEQLQFNIREGVLDTIVDPSWTTTSIPPKPVGFVLSDPDTWGDLTYEQIPMIKDYSSSLFYKYLDSYSKTGSIIETFETAMLLMLIENKSLPQRSEGWNFSDGVA